MGSHPLGRPSPQTMQSAVVAGASSSLAGPCARAGERSPTRPMGSNPLGPPLGGGRAVRSLPAPGQHNGATAGILGEDELRA
eukprot:5109918-Alexandrium_andersonii.AAC.1